MQFIPTSIEDLYLIKLDPLVDERGAFYRTYCKNEFEANLISQPFVQCNLSINNKKGTLRGMHFQDAPFQEGKLVRCTLGAIFDVVLDIRKNSPTYKKWVGFELTDSNYTQLYIGKGLAHGFQSLVDKSHVFYQMTEFYHPENANGIRFNDPEFDIDWPIKDKIISEKDLSYSDFCL